MPSGRAIMRLQMRQLLVVEAELVERHDAFLAVEDAQHEVFAVDGWLCRTRKSTARPLMFMEMRPSCGARVSAMFMPLITLRRTAIAAQ